MAFDTRELWLPVATPFLVQLPLALLLGLMTQYLVGRCRQQRMSRAMSYYLPAHVVRDMTEGRSRPGSVDKVVVRDVCFATDMSGFSTIAESESPDELATFMNAYFDALATALKRHGVDVTEFHADTIMCVWLAGERRDRQAASRGAGGDRSGRGDRGVRPHPAGAHAQSADRHAGRATSISATPAAAAGWPTASSAIRPTRRSGWKA